MSECPHLWVSGEPEEEHPSFFRCERCLSRMAYYEAHLDIPRLSAAIRGAEARGAARQREADLRWLRDHWCDSESVQMAVHDLAAQPFVVAQEEIG